MQVRTFQGTSTQGVLAQVKEEMGQNALILSSREFRKNKQRCYEVTVGIDRSDEPLNNEEMPSLNSSGPPSSSAFVDWQKDWDRFKTHLYTLMMPSINWEDINAHQKVVLEYLQNEGVENDVMLDLYLKLTRAQSNQAPQANPILSAFAELVPVQPFGSESWQQHLHVMVGPYGVGKTISALRMAFWLRQTKPEASIAFINMDSTRGSGRLMLRHFAELSGFISIDAVDKEGLMQSLKNTIDVDYVFIDLQSLAKDIKLVTKLEELGLAQAKQNVACHLCLSPQYSTMQLDAFVKQYRTDLPTSLVWTKLDESAQYGAIVNIAAHSQLPISTLSYGSELSGTLCPAESNVVWRILLKEQLPSKF